MATVTVSFSGATTEEIRTAQWALGKTNAERAAQQLPAYSGVSDMLEDQILSVIFPSWERAEAAETQATDNVKNLWENATDAQRAAAVAALQAQFLGV